MKRIERDVLGEVEIDDSCYYGVNTARAVDNFRISGLRADADHIISMVTIKEAAAIANWKGGRLSEDRKDAIVKACERIRAGELHDQFVIDVYQAGAGTSFNMNANEVIANLALTIAGRKKGEYEYIHPNDHVNMSQSTNDAFPTMMRITAVKKAHRLRDEVEMLIDSFKKKAQEFKDVVKPGRTHLQDAAPVTLGLEFSAWAYTMEKNMRELDSAIDYLMELNIGGTAVGTGINTSPNYKHNVVAEISRITGYNFRESDNLPGIMEFMTDFSRLMNAVTNMALDINKISNDIRLLYSGPGAGLHEITIPAVQQGSSIMPGKVNPSIAEAMNMICHSVIGAQQAVNFSVQAGQLELNVMMPNIDYELSRSLDIMRNGLRMFRTKLIDGIQANREACKEHLSKSFGSAALLNPYLGYDSVAKIVMESLHTGKSIKELALATGKITEKQFDEIMSSGIPK
ncbi:aspartate ammonia-lyase [Thermogymnomonas acidicola]|uniref:Aspartate ammonia-lyase n=1 Tax=Thermogymnomonas acidicola TaxID=399579 RepID=A0AA37F8T4_9ARCH|nr:aspartate ammonia-lyase [Thermogymnomonas acidicola]GGM68075.1 aspartate ammonia-lyase [Thermogymnomonas acidicola]